MVYVRYDFTGQIKEVTAAAAAAVSHAIAVNVFNTLALRFSLFSMKIHFYGSVCLKNMKFPNGMDFPY